MIRIEVMEMLTEERHRQILQALETKTFLTVKELVEALQVSESTIRRDLSLLEEGDYLVRVHGGAKRGQGLADEPDVNQKMALNPELKSKMAKKAVSLIEAEETIYVDAGTSTYALLQALDLTDVRVITNGIDHAQLCLEKGIETRLLGGKIKSETRAIIGLTALDQIRSYHFHKAFLGINGIDLQYGLTTPDEEEAMIKQAGIQMANRTFVLADVSKFDQVAFAKVGDLDEVTIISSGMNAQMLSNYRTDTQIMEA
ncbi:DeoR/GlpR transcriptional regulator [Facklamia sp. DSM 111018]|uniref:DeoR/GlpR transcriptional regulator n=3 Tax=Facklamia lactis TaxID=2749967 RepID=A0ABS0LSA4_9LACT|nr:DeoR/GlpR transcriptional regulator [Facklamia lactis]MBG9986963.1 DeoR/GlpR transcriptional regulator [Facklamia lactis]